MKVDKSKQDILTTIDSDGVKLGDIKKIAKELKTDHSFAVELWRSGGLHRRLLAVLIMDKKEIDKEFINGLVDDLKNHREEERNQISDWLLANQLMKSKKLVSLLESWEREASPTLRRLFWYHQARLRWTGQKRPGNTEHLLESLEKDMATAEPEVQWAMNFLAGWIGVHEPEHRSRCVKLGERLGLYKDQTVSRGCTPNYLPEFIRIEAAKRES